MGLSHLLAKMREQIWARKCNKDNKEYAHWVDVTSDPIARRFRLVCRILPLTVQHLGCIASTCSTLVDWVLIRTSLS